MEISATFVYGFGTDGGDPPRGICKTTLDGADKDTDIVLWSEDDGDFSWRRADHRRHGPSRGTIRSGLVPRAPPDTATS